ncbi:hypothetical protein ACN20G_11020 [Streptomyces sp. BI20]|uniref:hypothetical protein n=1 Tax=Streptomyces sp. BI20 TaxID=3403460 RepID=UPI003C7656A0
MVVHQHRRAAWAAAVAVVATGGLAGCGEADGADARPAGSVADGTAAVRSAADVLAEAGSARARTAMEMAAGGTRVTIRGEGGVDFAGRLGQLVVLLPADAAGKSEHRPITELLAPGALYMKNRGAGVPEDKWVRVDTTTLSDGNLVTGGATDPIVAVELLRSAEGVVFVGEEDLSGTKVRHYRGTADLGRAAAAAPEHVKGALTAAAKGFAKDAVPFDAYLDEEGRLRKVRHRFSYVNQGVIDVSSTTLLYGFGTPVSVVLPESRDIYAGRIAQ